MLALCVPFARHPNATQSAVSIALFPPVYIKNPLQYPENTHHSKTFLKIYIFSYALEQGLLTSILSRNKIDEISKFNFEIAVAHKVF